MAALQPEKLRTLAVFLPLTGLFLLMPPALLLFGSETAIGGLPLIVLYIFGVWGALIAAAAFLSRYLGSRQDRVDLPSHDGAGRGGKDPGQLGRPD